MSREPGLYLDDMVEAIARIREYTAAMKYDMFAQDRRTQDAVIRNLEIIGAAAARLPDDLRNCAPEIERRKIIALRNVLAHEYFGISLPMIWDVVQNKLASLETACGKLLDKQG